MKRKARERHRHRKKLPFYVKWGGKASLSKDPSEVREQHQKNIGERAFQKEQGHRP